MRYSKQLQESPVHVLIIPYSLFARQQGASSISFSSQQVPFFSLKAPSLLSIVKTSGSCWMNSD